MVDRAFIDQFLTEQEAPEAPLAGAFATDFLKGYDEELSQEFAPPAFVSNAAAKGDREDAVPWGAGAQLGNALTLGAVPYMDAFARPGNFRENLEETQYAQRAYERDNPMQSIGLDILGSLPPTLAALRLGGVGTGAVMARGAQMAPRIGAALETLGARVPNFISRAARGAVEGGAAGAMTSELTDQTSVGEDTQYGAAFGAGANMLLGPLGAAIRPAIAAAVRRADELGISLKSGQIPGAPGAARIMGGSTSESQIDDVYRALNRTIGQEGTAINRPILRNAMDDAGAQMDNITLNHAIPIGEPNLQNSIAALRARAANDLQPGTPEFNSVMGHIDRIADANLRGIAGTEYQKLTQKGSQLYRDLRGDNSITREWARDIKDTMDDAWETALPPDALQAWRDSRAVYSNAMKMWPSATETGDRINMNTLLSEIKKRSKFRGSERGDIGDVAEIYKDFLAPNMPKGDVKIPKGVGVTSLLGAGALGSMFGENVPALVSNAFATSPILSSLAAGTAIGYPLVGKALNTRAGRELMTKNLLGDYAQWLYPAAQELRPGTEAR